MQHPELHSAHSGDLPGYQPETVSLKGVAWFSVIFIGFAIVSHVLLWWIYAFFFRTVASADVRRSAITSDVVIMPEPRLQPSPGQDSTPWQDMDQLRRADHAEFIRRGWVNKQTGQLVIPDAIVQQVRQMSASKSTTQPTKS